MPSAAPVSSQGCRPPGLDSVIRWRSGRDKGQTRIRAADDGIAVADGSFALAQQLGVATLFSRSPPGRERPLKFAASFVEILYNWTPDEMVLRVA